MSAYLGNIRKFIENHEEQFDENTARQVLERAKTIAKLNKGLIISGNILEIFGDGQMAEDFFKEIQNPEHAQIFSESGFKQTKNL